MGAFDPYTPIDESKVIRTTVAEQSSPLAPPSEVLHRVVSDDVDTLPDDVPTVASKGVNMHGYPYAHVKVIPIAGAPVPTITLYQWSEAASSFIPYLPAKTATASGADSPFAYQFEVDEAIIWVAVTGTVVSGDSVKIYVSGSGIDRE